MSETMNSTGAGDTVDAQPYEELHNIDNTDLELSGPTALPKPPAKPMPVVGGGRQEYNMNYAKRGLAIIISNKTFDGGLKERRGAEVDARALEARFDALGFEVILYKDQKREQIERILDDASETDHTTFDCFCMVIMTHGGKNECIWAKDGLMRLDSVYERFMGDKCPHLVGKPKLFFIQACRGEKKDSGVPVHDGPRDLPKIPVGADFLIAHSVVPGFYAWRNCIDGSWFVQALNSVLQEHGETMDLLSMMTIVNRKVAYNFESDTADPKMSGMKQIPCITSMLTKDVYFRPKSSSNSTSKK